MSSNHYLADVHEIRNLKHDYCEVADRCCSAADAQLAADEIVQLFVEDGVLEVPPEYGGRQVGRAAIHAFWMQQSVVFRFADHLVFNERIEVSGLEARGRWKNLIPATTLVDNEPVAQWILGDYDDEYVKVSGQWRIKSLKVSIKRVFGRDEAEAQWI